MSDGSRHVQVPLLKNWLPGSGEIAYTAHLESGFSSEQIGAPKRANYVFSNRSSTTPAEPSRYARIGDVMQYFAYLAEQAFHESSNGQRLFYRGGPWSRPYIIPDDATEKRLFEKQQWIMGLLVIGMIFGQPLLFAFFPYIVKTSFWFLVYLLAVVGIFWLVGYFMFRRDLAILARIESRPSLRTYFGNIASRHQSGMLALRIAGSILGVASAILMLAVGWNAVVAWGFLGAMLACTAAWSYALYVKTTCNDIPDRLA